MLIQWSEELSVGNTKLDQEHQRWVEILNNFYSGLRNGKPKEKLLELVQEMLDYTKYHFSSEEEYMFSVNYPGIDDHKITHAEYIGKITEYHDKLKEGKLILSLEVTSFLKSWLINHIKGVDQQYSSYVDRINV